MNYLINLKDKKKIFLKKENLYYLIIVSLIFFFDRFSKSKIISNFNENIYYINDYVNFNLIWNIGIGFGLLSSDSSLFYIFVLSTNVDKLIYSIIIGGALGNFYDRLTYKAVPDFIDLHYNNFHWFVFNVADIFITLGIIAMLMSGLLKKN